MFYEGAMIPELANIEPLLLEKYWAAMLRASGHIFINQPIHNLVLYLFLFKGMLFNTYCWLMNIELIANSPVTHAWKKFIYHTYFLCKTHHSPFALRDTRQHFAWGPFSTVKPPSKSTKMRKTWHYIGLQEDTSLQYKSWNGGRGSPYPSSAGNVYLCACPWIKSQNWLWDYK